MFRHANVLQLSIAAITVLGASGSLAQAAITLSSTIVKASASAQVAPHPVLPADSHNTVAPTGDFAVSAHQADSFPLPTPALTSDASSSVTAHVDASGAGGSATLISNWLALSTLATSDPGNSGNFDGTTQFVYSFSSDVAFTIFIDVSSAYSSPTTDDFADILMGGNRGVGFGTNALVEYTDLPQTGPTHLEYSRPGGPTVYKIVLDQAPGAALSPWVNGTRIATTGLTFTIVSVPEPATGLTLALAGIPLLARSRRRGALH